MILSRFIHIVFAALWCAVAISTSHGEFIVDQPRSRRPRLAGGIHVGVGVHSYMASLQEYGNHICAGTVYSKDIILTAAHCVIGKWYKALSVRVGSIYRDYKGQIIKVAKVAYHEEFNSKRQLHDIALLKLKRTIEFGNLSSPASRVKLLEDDEKIRPGSVVTVVGWGYFDEREIFSDRLTELTMNTIPSTNCRWNFEDQYLSSIPVRKICAKCGPGKGCSCHGDSGGPVMFKGRQAGIISTGTCASTQPENFPAVGPYHDWIDENVEDLEDPNRKPFIMHSMSGDDIAWNRYHQGKPINIEDAPFLVAFVTKDNIMKCSGSIIGPKHVLTSASCAKQISKTKYKVLVGSTHSEDDSKSDKKLYKIISIIWHEKYSLDAFGRAINDIALIEVDDEFDGMRILELFSGEKISNNATVYGWNRVKQDSEDTRMERLILKTLPVRLLILSKFGSHCGIISNEVKRSEGRFCAMSSLKGMCISNNGGPIVVDNYLLGVVSWTNDECSNFWYPAVYTGILYFEDWIHKTMHKLGDELR